MIFFPFHLLGLGVNTAAELVVHNVLLAYLMKEKMKSTLEDCEQK